LEFLNSVWSPCKIELTEKIDKVQKRATEYHRAKVLHTWKDLEKVLGTYPYS